MAKGRDGPQRHQSALVLADALRDARHVAEALRLQRGADLRLAGVRHALQLLPQRRRLRRQLRAEGGRLRQQLDDLDRVRVPAARLRERAEQPAARLLRELLAPLP